MVILLKALKIAFISLLIFMLCVIIFAFFLIIFEPEKKDLTKEDWKLGYREKGRFK